MRRNAYAPIFLLVLIASLHAPSAAAADWDPITAAEKDMKSSPLDPGAGAVVLFKRGKIEVTERSSLFYITRVDSYVRIKIFNDAGRDAANVSLEAFKNVRVSKIEGRTILPSGEIVPLDSSKVFTGKSFQAGKGFAYLETSFTFPSVVPGAIIEYQVEETKDGFFPAPWIFDTPDVGTVDSVLEVTIAPRLGMNQFPLETTANKITVQQSNTVRGEHFNFSVKNLRPIQREPFSLPYRDQATMILFTPTDLAFGNDNYPLITKWDDVGAEITREFNEMQKSEKAVHDKARELAEKNPDPRQKAEVIYKYIQQNIVSSNLIGVGLGRTADEILTTKRGDPDEINALMVLMLKEVKVDADVVLLATQNWQSIIRGFPNFSQFSRIVTRINFKGGAIYVDPADAGASFGELPWFDKGITGLAVKGSKVQEAPIAAGTPEDNISTTKVSVEVKKDWSTEGNSEVEFKGAEAIEFRNDFLGESPENIEKTLTSYFGYGHSDAEVSQIVHPDFRDSSLPMVLKAHLKETLSNESGPGELLLNPWLDDQYERPLFKAAVRHSAVRFNNPEKRASTSVWQLAQEIKVEQLPKEIKVDNDFGGFSHSCTQSANTVTCTRMFYLKKMNLTTNLEYLNAKKFFDDIAKNDQEVVVLRAQ